MDDKQYDLSRGIFRLLEPNNPTWPKGYVWDLVNMVYERDAGEPEKMKGSSRVGGTTDFGGAVTGLFDYAEGTRLIACSADGKVHERSTGDFSQATGGTGFDAGGDTRWTAQMYYGATTAADLLIMSNGVDAPQKYTSGAGVSALGGSAPALGLYPTPWVGRLWMVQGSTLFYSAADNAELWTDPGGSFHADRGSGDIKGLKVFMNHLFIFKRNRIFVISPESTLENTSVWQISGSIGCSSHLTIKEGSGLAEGALYFLGDNGIHALSPTDRSGGFVPVNISEAVKPILDNRSKANQSTMWADFNEDRAEYYLQYGTGTSTPVQGMICNASRGRTRNLRWTRHEYSNLTAGSPYISSGEVLQFVGDTNGRVYQMHVGYNRNGSGYEGRFQSPSWAQAEPGSMKQYHRVYADVKANGNYRVDVNLGVGRAGHSAPGGSDIALDNLGATNGWGEGFWGAAAGGALWGGSGLPGRWIRPTKVGRGYHMRAQVSTTGIDTWFKVNGFITQFTYGAEQVRAA